VTRAACGLLAALCCCAPLASQDVAAAAGMVRVERVAGGFGYTEGPAWSREGFLVFSDVPGNRLLTLTPGQRPATLHEMPGGPSGNAFDTKGRLYTCEARARRVVRFLKGKPEVLAERWEGKRLNAPNDIAVRKDGNAWFTDPAFGYQQDTRELDFYGVFHITAKLELKLVAKSAGRPNGVALSPNGRILYVADSDRREVRAWDLDGRGDASKERVFVSGIEGVPGGIRTDEKGNLYVAAAGIAVYSPQGKLLATIPIAETPSNCAFGDPDGKTLYITAGGSLYRVRLDGTGAESH
jgi:gluconolactonase